MSNAAICQCDDGSAAFVTRVTILPKLPDIPLPCSSFGRASTPRQDREGEGGGRYWVIHMTAKDDAGPLLQTKLYIPRPRRARSGRPRLLERLRRGAESKLTLLSAPAGFGKTTLLAEWLAAVRRADDGPSAWLSLDPSDSQALSFWSYVIAALQTVAPGVGADSLSLLRQPQPPPIELVLDPALNELSATSHEIVLVLDDYHVIDAHDVHEGMAFLLEHLPPQVHVVIATRADPPLPLARLRGRAELVEIRAADLRFTPDEASPTSTR